MELGTRMSRRNGTKALFAGRHFDREVILLRVRWYLRYKLSLRDLVEMMAERGYISLDKQARSSLWKASLGVIARHLLSRTLCPILTFPYTTWLSNGWPVLKRSMLAATPSAMSLHAARPAPLPMRIAETRDPAATGLSLMPAASILHSKLGDLKSYRPIHR